MDGIYRVSGNLAVIQRLRHKADHGKHYITHNAVPRVAISARIAVSPRVAVSSRLAVSSRVDPEAATRRRHFEFQLPPANNCISQNKPPSDKLWLSQLELFALSNNSIT